MRVLSIAKVRTPRLAAASLAFFWIFMVASSLSTVRAASEHSNSPSGYNSKNDSKSSAPTELDINPTVTMATLRRVWRRGEKDSAQAFLADLANLSHLKGQHRLLTPSHSKRDSSYTKLWTNDQWEFHQARSLRRYGRHLLSWTGSPTAHAVLPAVATLVVWSACVFGILHRFPSLLAWVRNASLVAVLSSFTAPLSLLLALRTNRSLDRLLEARSVWGVMVRAATTLAGLSATYIRPIDENQALLMCRYLSVFGWIMKGHFRGEDDAVVLRTVLPPEEAAWLERSPADNPTAMIFRMRQILAGLVGELPLVASCGMDDRLVELEVSLGICNRLRGSPIPPTYTRHTSRVLCLYLGLLPIALVGGSTCGLLATLVNVAVLSYVFIGIDEIGVEIEHPFPLLPLFHLSTSVQDRVGQQYLMSQPQQQHYQTPRSESSR
jgi:putative membrane protein